MQNIICKIWWNLLLLVYIPSFFAVTLVDFAIDHFLRLTVAGIMQMKGCELNVSRI